MDSPLLLHKPVGITPYQAIQLFKQQYPSYQHSKISAAGRLDPMAEGLLLLLVDQQNKQQANYLNLSKTYQAIILFGISTDTYDLLGMPQEVGNTSSLPSVWPKILDKYKGDIEQSYPPYSAVQVNGKPLHYWAHRSLLDDIDIPKKKRNIISLYKEKDELLSNNYIINYMATIIPQIEGRFRQQAILETWQTVLTPPYTYRTSTVHVSCSSGTYIRSLVHQIGQDLNIPTTTLAIKRLSIGSYALDQSIILDHPNYHLSLFDK